jgi:hypothetical protein
MVPATLQNRGVWKVILSEYLLTIPLSFIPLHMGSFLGLHEEKG